jgi:MFS family permease
MMDQAAEAKSASPLADPTYRRLFAAQALSLTGTGLSSVALALLAYELAGSSAGVVLGTALALKMVAYIGIAPVIGAIAHRLPRKSLLVALDASRAALLLLFPFVDAVWQIYVLIFLLNAGSAAFTPTFQATIPDVLGDEARYTRALSLSRLAYDLENLLSPTLAALLLSVTSFHALFALNGVAFIASGLLVVATTLPRAAASDRPGGLWANLGFGMRAYLATPRLRGLLALNLAVAAAGAMVIVNTVVYVRDMLGQDETGVAYAMMAAGAGSMAMALLLPRLLERVPERLAMLVGGGLLSAALALGAVLQPGFSGLLALWLLLGAGSSLVQTPSGRLLRRLSRVPDRPAYFAAHFALSHACWLLAYPLAGWLGGATTFSVVFGALAALVFASTIIGALVWPAIDSEVIEHLHEEHEHCHLHVHDAHHQHEHEGWERPKPHVHAHRHAPLRHRHGFAIDLHHRRWPA